MSTNLRQTWAANPGTLRRMADILERSPVSVTVITLPTWLAVAVDQDEAWETITEDEEDAS